MTTVVVLGGGFAGTLTAAVLARHADRVVLVEGDRYPAGAGPRRGLPQARHTHVLVTGGARALEALLPGTLRELSERGAHRRGLSDGTLILTSDGWYHRHDTEAYLISCSRGLLDAVVRRRALGGGAVTVLQGTRALGLTGDAARVTGVSVRRGDGPEETIEADLVVDATGRRSRAPRWLADLGAPEVEEALLSSGLAYATRLYRAPAGLAAAIPAVMLHPAPTAGRPAQGATVYPIEDGRWVVTLTGTRGGEPPTGERAFADFARGLRSPIVAELMAAAEPDGPVRPYRDTADRRRFFERARLPDGFLAVGDAVVALNPVHSHGMSVAALSALRLEEELTRHGKIAPSAAQELREAVAAEAEWSWRMATGDAGPGHRAGPARREATAFERRVREHMARAALSTPELAAGFFRAHALIPPPAAGGPNPSRGAPVRAEPPLTDQQAIAQYPGLAAWWRARPAPAPAGAPYPGSPAAGDHVALA
ncbi:hypothetical protein Sme01_11910 [Sphaerisporangium melleum]|uniref:FAD-binding domain-containing protein n=1 Tax=Sphaerisporangium melleum TaxID=321316 RepID=A0A917RGV0_9ACTN|nr:FAD-dependent monooxygenase [Sphaerisporangium melleum]GGL07203.1 hypothetical protein GCM10007964_56870 [Sphaerisporangium melleum]GII68715.1 hypothetical protein Sme01_11910 [Sphaerisporangium melleum]